MKLSQDIRSSINSNKIYGAQGDTVAVITYHGSVAIVEGIDGNRFRVKAELLVNYAEPSIIQVQKEVNHVKSKRTSKPQSQAEGTLF